MPELCEILYYKTVLETITNDFEMYGIQKMPISKWTDVSFSIADPEKPLPPLFMKWDTKGKELALECYGDNILIKRYNFQLGLNGIFVLCDEDIFSNNKKIKNNTVLRILLRNVHDQKSAFLCLVDTRRYAKWNENSYFNPDKGPCPYKTPAEFEENILLSLHLKTFSHPIYEILLNQKYFNGVGNWMRAVLLYRVGGDWKLPAKDYIKLHNESFFMEMFSLVEETYQGLLEGGLPDSFYYPYGSKKFIMDSSGRKFFYS